MSGFQFIRRVRSRRGLLRIGLAVAACGVPTLVAVIVLATQPHPSLTQASDLPERQQTQPSPVLAELNPFPPNEPVPAGFTPESVSFVSADQGWVLGSVICGPTNCPLIARTLDGGRSWSTAAVPPLAVKAGYYDGFTSLDQIRFADPRNGWAFNLVGQDDLWCTHDGGTTWSRVRLPDGLADNRVMALSAAAGTVWLAVGNADGIQLLSSPVDADRWTVATLELPFVSTQWQPDVQLVLRGTSGWLVEIATYQVGADGVEVGAIASGARLRGGRWARWTPPCTAQPGGGDYLAATSNTDLTATCGWITRPDSTRLQQPDQQHLLVSRNGGDTFADVATVSVGPDEVIGLAATAAGHLVADVGNALLTSFDDGTHWTTSYTGWISDLSFVTATEGVAVHWIPDSSGSHYTSQLLITRDGGRTWVELPFAS